MTLSKSLNLLQASISWSYYFLVRLVRIFDRGIPNSIPVRGGEGTDRVGGDCGHLALKRDSCYSAPTGGFLAQVLPDLPS